MRFFVLISLVACAYGTEVPKEANGKEMPRHRPPTPLGVVAGGLALIAIVMVVCV